MKRELKPVRSEVDYEAALIEVERLWGTKSDTPDGNRLDILATLIDAYEAERRYDSTPAPTLGHFGRRADPAVARRQGCLIGNPLPQ